MSALSQTLPDNHANATNALLATLAKLDTMLAPLFVTPNALSETLAKLDSEKRCQLELLIAYAINTLAYINLKTNGTTPATHPVMQELKRIQGYTLKLRQVTQGSKPGMGVDKDAATRFIKGALAANITEDRKATEAEDEGAIVESQGTHKRFDEADSSEAPKSSKAKGAASAAAATGVSGTKKRVMDPFKGYDDSKKKTKSG